MMKWFLLFLLDIDNIMVQKHLVMMLLQTEVALQRILDMKCAHSSSFSKHASFNKQKDMYLLNTYFVYFLHGCFSFLGISCF